MTSEWERVKARFAEGLLVPTAEQGAWLSKLAEVEPELVDEVRALLAAELQAGDFLVADAVSTDDLYDALASSWAVGQEVGPWRITRLLGHGGTGVVHLAERGEPRQRVALKLLRPGADSLDGIRRLVEEARTLARLEHPGIARLVDGGSTPEGLPWIAMEFVDGEPIDSACDRGRLSVRERLRLLVEVARTVGDLHAEGLVHRDLKPGNVFLDRRGRPRVLDLGLARWLETGVTATATRARRLTPSCAAPEQIRGGDIAPATDVWALGVLLCRLVVDTTPWPSTTNEAAMLGAICEGPLQPPSRLLHNRAAALAALRSTDEHGLRLALTPALDRVALACLEREPGRRYRNAHELADDLERVLADQEPSAPARALAFDRHRFRRLAPQLAAAAVALAALWGWWQSERARDAAETRAANLGRVVAASATAGEATTCAAIDEARALGRDLGDTPACP